MILGLAAVLLAAALLVHRGRQPPILYTVTFLPSLGGRFTLPYAINDRGQVAGFSQVGPSTYHLFLWDRGKGMQDLGRVDNRTVDINSEGVIAGTMEDPNGNRRAFVWAPDSGRHVLGTLGGDNAETCGLNDRGQVVGASETIDGVLHAFVWDATNGMRDLTPSFSGHSRAWSINDAGQVVVFMEGGPVLAHADEGVTPSSPAIPARGLIEINSDGHVAGVSRTGRRTFDIVVWHADSGLRTLVQLTADSAGSARINDVGQVCFSQERRRSTLRGRALVPPQGKNYLWDPKRGRIPLSHYVPVGLREDLWLTDLNNKGCMVGAVQSRTHSRSRGVLLEPIPERWGP